LKRACKNYATLLELKAVVDHKVRRERVEELKGDERNRLVDALEEFDKINDAVERFVLSKAYKEFLGYSWNEELIKWAGKQRVSVGYMGARERGAEYWLMDIPLEYDLPPDKTVADLFELYRFAYVMHVPTQTEAEANLLDFLEWIKKWPKTHLHWVIRNLYPLSDATGGFFSVVRKVVALASLRDAWEDIISGWKRYVADDLKAMPEYEVLKAVFLGDAWRAERYLRDLADEVAEEFAEKYGMTTADIERVKEEFYARARELFRERVAPEMRIREVYEQIKPLIPPEKVELTRAGLWKAIRWLFLHPTMSIDAFASAHIFPLGFTTEEARQIALKIAEKVTKLVVRPPLPPIEFVKVRMLQDAPAIVGADLKVYGPFKKREVYELPKENAEVLVKQGIAIHEVPITEYERELRDVKTSIERLGKFERLAYFLNNRLKWRYLTIEDQKEILREIVKEWRDKDYQTFYDMYPDKVNEVAPTFSLLGLTLPPPPVVPETVPALKAKLEEEEAKRREAELKLEEEVKKAEAVAVAVEVAPPPVREPVPAEEQVVRRECYEYFRKLWDEIRKGAALEVSIPTVSRRTGIGADLIRKALGYARLKNIEKIEKLANSLIECQCELEQKHGQSTFKCRRDVESNGKNKG
jgi:hypothetical protein